VTKKLSGGVFVRLRAPLIINKLLGKPVLLHCCLLYAAYYIYIYGAFSLSEMLTHIIKVRNQQQTKYLMQKM
jgi:hypothetical protein